MASPHVAGVAARYLENPTAGATPAQVRNQIVNNATTNRLSGIPAGTANRLLFWSGTR
jgi:subtilisin family serine protease